MLLALDTSTRYASLALVDGSRMLAELTWEVGQRHSTELLERLEWLLASSGVRSSMLTGIAVALGPGSFNGVRVALAAAKSLAFARGVPLYGHPTLDVIAWGAASSERPVWALLEAGRGQVYAAAYATPARTARGWAPRDGYHVMTPAELAMHIGKSVLFCGEWSEATRGILQEALAERAWFASPLSPRRASWLAELALERVDGGQADDPAALEPLYLRRPAITVSKKVPRGGTTNPAVERRQSDHGGEGESRALRR
jgi:tRNA threonylcarbamoyladenosine biosynthesis protein TsaB